MGPTVFFYPRGLLALVWLVLMRHAMWSSERSVACRPLPPPITPPRPRSHEPQAFAGLTSKPHGAACEQEATPPTAPPAVPPDPMPVSHRRPRRLDTAMPFCPHATCEYRGGVGLGHLRAKGRSEEHTSELQSRGHLVCRLLLEKKKNKLKRSIRYNKKKPR